MGIGTSFIPVKNSGPLYSSAWRCACSVQTTRPAGRATAWRQSTFAAVPLVTKCTRTSRSNTSQNRSTTRAVSGSSPYAGLCPALARSSAAATAGVTADQLSLANCIIAALQGSFDIWWMTWAAEPLRRMLSLSTLYGSRTQGALVPDSGQLAPLRLESTPVLVADRLRAGILDGTFPPRTQLSEVALSQQLSVSRGPIREAMQRLLQEGLLRGERNRGVFVIDLGASDVRDIYLARSAVERTAASIVASSGTDEDFAMLQSMVDKLAAAVDDNWVELTKLDLQFHLALVAAAASPRLDRMFRTLVAESQLCIARLEPFYAGRGEVVREHQEIIDAIRARDLDAGRPARGRAHGRLGGPPDERRGAGRRRSRLTVLRRHPC